MRIQLTDTIMQGKDTTFPVLFHATSTYFMDSFKGGITTSKNPLNYELINAMFDELAAAGKEKGISLDAIGGCIYRRDAGLHSYRYGGFYLTNSIMRLDIYLYSEGESGLSEILRILVKGYRDFRNQIGGHYIFKTEGAQKFLESFYDMKTDRVLENIRPMAVVLYDVPVKYVTSEGGKGLGRDTLPNMIINNPGFKDRYGRSLYKQKLDQMTDEERALELMFPSFKGRKEDMAILLKRPMMIEDYLYHQGSWEYRGPEISRDQYDIIEFDPEELAAKRREGGDAYFAFLVSKL